MIPYFSSGFSSDGQSNGRAVAMNGKRTLSPRDRDDSFAQLMDMDQQEAHEYQYKIEQLQSKIATYESMTMDLERRLEDQALQCMQAESESISNDKKWAARFEEVTKEVEEWKRRCQKEAEKAESLRNHLSRTERELYGILQKKHQILRGSGSGAAAVVSTSRKGPEVETPVSQMFSGSNTFAQGPVASIEIDKRAIHSLNEFLGIK